MHDRFMEVLAVNDLYRERLGNLVGHPSWEPYVLHSNEAMFPVERAIVEGRGARSEQILRDKNGKEIPVLVHTAPILNNEGEVELVLELSVDEQESRRLREELRVTRERFRQLFEESPCYVSVVGRDLQVLEANRAFRHTFGMQSGKRCYELFAGSSAPCDECPVQRSFQDGKPCHTEKVVIDHEGRPVNVLVWTAPLRDTSGNITECIEMATDITELRQLQDRLASLGLLMGSTAHGIKGMLTALDGSVYRLGSGIDKGDEARTRDSLKDMRPACVPPAQDGARHPVFRQGTQARLEHSGRGGVHAFRCFHGLGQGRRSGHRHDAGGRRRSRHLRGRRLRPQRRAGQPA